MLIKRNRKNNPNASHYPKLDNRKILHAYCIAVDVRGVTRGEIAQARQSEDLI